ncbi:MAG: hypothetical protein NTW56_14050 [Alphaproteobacteria bacterium]|nr:hypothetical protein [Alphaproteobacteria bacterium]
MEYDLGFEQSDLWADGVEYIYDDFGTFMGAVREVSFGAFGTINGDEHYYFWDGYRDTWGQLHIYDGFDNQPWAKKVLENWNPWAQSWEIEKVFDAQGRLMEKTTYDFYGLDSESIIWRDFYSESGVWTARSGIYENQNGYRIDFTGGTITSLKLYDRNGDEDWSRREYENLAGNTWEQQSVFNDNDVKISQEFNDIYGRDAGHQKYTDYWNATGQYTGRSGVYQDGKNFVYEMDLSRNSYSRIEISDNPNIETWSRACCFYMEA